MRALFLALVLMVFGSTLCASLSSSPARPPHPEVDFPFPVGETLVYDIYWGWIGVGESRASTSWHWDESGGRWLLLIRFRTRTNNVLEKLYPVDDVVETLVDPHSKRPLSFRLDLSEGRHTRKETTLFDWDNLRASFRGIKNGKERVKDLEIRENTRDLVSFMYFMRETPFAPNRVHAFEVLSDDKLYDLTVKSLGTEDIHLKEHGKVASMKLAPKASFEGVFNRKGEMELWVSTDPRRILTKAEVDTPFANVKILLRTVTGPGGDRWSHPAPTATPRPRRRGQR